MLGQEKLIAGGICCLISLLLCVKNLEFSGARRRFGDLWSFLGGVLLQKSTSAVLSASDPSRGCGLGRLEPPPWWDLCGGDTPRR